MFAAATAQVARALAGPLAAAGLAALVQAAAPRLSPRVKAWWIAAAALLAYVGLSTALWSWIVDDAAITFAYVKHLVEGRGLVLHPGHRPEEAYSNTLWLLLLAGAARLGISIPLAAKCLGLASGAAALGLVVHAEARTDASRSAPAYLAVLLGAPFVVWSSSGLEHGLQAALIALAVTAPALQRRGAEWTIGAALAALVLLRPETPLLVAAAAATLGLDAWRDPSRPGLRRLAALAPVVALPAVVWVGLTIFRVAYFGDPLPNPYYAKAAGAASFAHAVNPFGASWRYVLRYLASSGALAVVPLVLLGRFGRQAHPSVRLAAALVLAQLLFVLYASGDWMMESRFIAPVIPAFALLVAHGLARVRELLDPRRFAVLQVAVVALLSIGTASALVEDVARPTTPHAVVARIGRHFVDLGHELGVAAPSLAHHDAGGTSFDAGIDLVDLGGLGTRDIAKHFTDRAFILRYLLEVRKPTFVFGSASVFAAGFTKFFTAPEFLRDYVPLDVEGDPAMKADLCYVRRDVVHDTPHVRVESDGTRIVRAVATVGP